MEALLAGARSTSPFVRSDDVIAMRLNTRHLLLLTAVIAILVAVGRPLYLDYSRPQNCTLSIAASHEPGVNGFKVFDADGIVRVVILEKRTSVSTGSAGRSFKPNWFEYFISNGGKISLWIDGSPVYFGDEVVVYYAASGGKPKRIVAPLHSISEFEFPHEIWSRLIEKRTDEQSDRPETPTVPTTNG